MNIFPPKRRLGLLALLFATLSLGAAAEDPAKPAKEPDNRPVLAIVVSENLQNQGSAFTDFDRIDIAIHEVAKKRNWPVKIVADRFAAGVPDYETEVRIFSQPVRRDTPAELVFRAWTSLYIKGKKTDFGIVEYRHYPRLGENMNDTLEKVFLGYANVLADKLEPILFPKTDKPAPAKP